MRITRKLTQLITSIFNFVLGNHRPHSSDQNKSAVATSKAICIVPEPEGWRKGRNVKEGYTRGWGLQFGNLKSMVLCDPIYQTGVALINNRTVVSKENRINIYLLIRYYLNHIPTGNIIEFGSYKGGNAIFMAYLAKLFHPTIHVYALDTFTGMPRTDSTVDLHREGDFSDVDLDELRHYVKKIGLDNLTFVPGLFQDTTIDLLQKTDKNFSLVHIDCDIYSAAAYAYETIKSRVVDGGYIIFDDATYSSCIGATEAVESLVIQGDQLHSEQIYPHFVFRWKLPNPNP